MFTTQYGESKVVLQDIGNHEQTQEAIELLKLFALGIRQIETGQVSPAADVIERLQKKLMIRR